MKFTIEVECARTPDHDRELHVMRTMFAIAEAISDGSLPRGTSEATFTIDGGGFDPCTARFIWRD